VGDRDAVILTERGGLHLATIRKRLGHANLQTVLRYAEQSDHTADTELRAWRRHHTPPEPRRGLPPAQPGGATTGVAAAG